MRKPLSYLVADVFMSNMEQKILNTNPPAHSATFWNRFVDVLYTWAGPQDELDQFYDSLNRFYPAIDLTMEIGSSETHYLDVTIRLEEKEKLSYTTI